MTSLPIVLRTNKFQVTLENKDKWNYDPNNPDECGDDDDAEMQKDSGIYEGNRLNLLLTQPETDYVLAILTMDDSSPSSEEDDTSKAIMVDQNHFSTGGVISVDNLVSEDEDEDLHNITDDGEAEAESDPVSDSSPDRATTASEVPLPNKNKIDEPEEVMGAPQSENEWGADNHVGMITLTNEQLEAELLNLSVVENTVEQPPTEYIDIPISLVNKPLENATVDSRSMDVETSSSSSEEGERTLTSSEDEDEDEDDLPITVEAKEERLLEKYKQTLSLLKTLNVTWSQEKKNRALAKAQEKFEDILEEIPDDTENDRMKALKCAVLKNLSNLLHGQKNYGKALEYLSRVAELDYTDVVMIHNMGDLAIKMDNFPLAASYFQDALAIRPAHWPSLDNLMTITYALNYFPACLTCCYSALQMEPSHHRALTFVHKIFHDFENFREQWYEPLKKVSRNVGQPLKPFAKRFIDEADFVKRKWFKPELNGENNPALQLNQVSFPVLAEHNFQNLIDALLKTFEDLDAKKLWNAMLIVNKPDLPTSSVAPDTSTARSAPELLISGASQDNSTMSGEGPPKKRKLDPVCLEHAEKRRSGRRRDAVKSDEGTIREMLTKFIKEIYSVDDESLQFGLRCHQKKSSVKGNNSAEELFKTPKDEELAVVEYLRGCEELRINQMFRKLLQFLAERTDKKWTESMSNSYLSLYYRIAHEEFFPKYEKYGAALEDRTREAILFSLCALELVVDYWSQCGKVDDMPRNFEKELNYLAVWPYTGVFKPSDQPMLIRILMLLHKWHGVKGDMEKAKYFLEEVSDRLTPNMTIHLPNLSTQPTISKDALAQLVQGEKSAIRLVEVDSLYKDKMYADVLDIAEDLFADSDQMVEFSPHHAKIVLASAEYSPDSQSYVNLAEKVIRNILTQFMRFTENNETERRLPLRAVLLEICDSVLKFTTRKQVQFDKIALESLQMWAVSLLEVCVLSVHTLEGSIRRPSSLSPWIILYLVLRAGEMSAEVFYSPSGDSSVHYLEEVHAYLGGHSWCTLNNGAFLCLAVDRFLAELLIREEGIKVDSKIPREDIEYDLDQCFHCLYGVTKSKSRYLQHHNVKTVELSLPRAVPLFTFFLPAEIPRFDGFRADCISQETVNVFTKIRPLVTNVPYLLSKEDIQSFIRRFDPITETPEFPEPQERQAPAETDIISQNLFYLLADYYFKNAENVRAALLFLTDLRVNPTRLDSWAGLALNRGVEVEKKFKSFALKPSKEIFIEASEAIQCFAIACKIDSNSEHLWIECGNIVYPLSSFLSRQLAQSEQFRMKSAERGKLRHEREFLLRLAQKAYSKAEDCDDRSETWLCQYMLGKTYEKLERKKPWKYLAQYSAAADCLHADGATYPPKIAYYKAPRLSVEALEMYYRIFASSVKYLSRPMADISQHVEAFKAIEYYLNKAENSPLAFRTELDKNDSGSSTESTDDPEVVARFIMNAQILDRLELRDMVEKDNLEVWRLELVQRCITGLRTCLNRYPEHYKSLYRLARLYYEFPPLRDLQKTKDLLLGPSISWQDCPHMPCAGLFQQRKPTMFFRGVWHIKSEEIQRSLSFASHMYRAVHLLISVSAALRENLLLLQIQQQLAKPPEADSKKYLRVVDYHFLSNYAMKSALLSVIARMEDYETDTCSEDVRVAFLREVLKMWQTAKKEDTNGRNVELANTMLAQGYLRLVEGMDKAHCPVPVPPALIEKAARYIQHVQIRPKPPSKPAVVINLSTGLPEEPEVAQEVSSSNAETASSSTGEPSSTEQQAQKQPESAEVGKKAETEDDNDDLMNLDLNVRLPAGMNFADFNDVMTDDSVVL